MTVLQRKKTVAWPAFAIIATSVWMSATTQAESSGQSSLTEASQQNKFAFILFYKANDDKTQAMYKVLNGEIARRNNTTFIPVDITDAHEKAVVDQFDASRTPMPAVMAVAPMGPLPVYLLGNSQPRRSMRLW